MADYLRVCEESARAGGRALLDWVGRFAVREKGPADLVTEADLASQEAVHAVISKAFPDHEFLSEEGDATIDVQAPFCWIVDPLDGTTNYVHQMPHYAVSVALASRGEPLVGVIYDPVHDECFAAERGKGVWLNGKALKTSTVDNLGQALVAASFSASVRVPSLETEQFMVALAQCQALRRTGSAALNLAYVAAGRLDAFWALSTNAWDVAAGVLMVQEAGGVVSLLDGQPFSLNVPHPIASGTPALQAEFLRMLQGCRRA